MNQLMLPLPVAQQDYFTAAELAAFAKTRGIPTFPATERGARAYADREAWNALPAHLARPRRAQKAGGRPAMEYHYSILPEILQRTLHGMAAKASLVQRVADEGEADRRRLAALQTSQIPAGARRVMEARAEVLLAIEGYSASQGRPRAWGIDRFLAAQEAWHQRQDVEDRRDRGEILTGREAASLALPLDLTSAEGFDLAPLVLATANDRRNGASKISDRSLFRWFKARDERGVVALAPLPPKVAQPIPDGFYEFMRFWAVPAKISVPDAYGKYLADAALRIDAQPMTLTLDQVQHILRKRLKGLDKYVGREGLLTLRSRMAYVTRTTDDMWPTTVYTADGKTFDAEVADPVSQRAMRPEITSVLDVATRKCVGYAVSRKENVIAVTEALRRSCSGHGICAIFYTDRGAGYKNKTFDADVGGLMGRLGITKMHALPYNSQAKGIIERFNAVWNVLAKSFPTYIGADMDKEAKKAVHKETRTEIREFGIARRLPSWEEFVAAVEKTIADYNDRPHSGLPRFEDPETGKRRHMTPNEAWAAHVANGFEPVTIDPAEADDLFRPYVTRTASRSQVQWNTNQYFHEALERYHDERVMVGYDLHQADRVWVREFDPDSGNPGRLICIAIYAGNAERYIPLTAERKAVEDRSKAAIKRLDEHRRAAEAELDAPWLIEQQAEVVADFIDLVPEAVAEPVALAVDNTKPLPAAPKRRVFATDAALAEWALQHPDQLSANQIRVLRDCISNSTARKVLEMSGIDTEALRILLRAAA